MTETKKKGCGRYIAIGCLSVVLLIAVGGYFAYRAIMGGVSEMTDKYTSTEQLKLTSIIVSADEAKNITQRVSDFANGLKQNSQPPPLVLTERDINVLIQRHPAWSETYGKVIITIKNDRILGQISLPLDKFGDMFKGRYLNGTAGFRIGLTAGHLSVFIDSIKVGNKTIPEEIIRVLQTENLAEGVNSKPDYKEIIQRLDSIEVRDGRLYITPKVL